MTNNEAFSVVEQMAISQRFMDPVKYQWILSMKSYTPDMKSLIVTIYYFSINIL